MERTPWWSTLSGQLPKWDGRPVGCKPDGGGSIRGQGRVGPMRLHRAAHNMDLAGALAWHTAEQPANLTCMCCIGSHSMLATVILRVDAQSLILTSAAT